MTIQTQNPQRQTAPLLLASPNGITYLSQTVPLHADNRGSHQRTPQIDGRQRGSVR